MNEPPHTPRESLERFVAENDDLLKLEESIGRFNIFDALGIARAEVKHSNFLAWLLDPVESHGHGDLFLNAMVMDMLRHTPPELRPLSPVELDGIELFNVVVRREWPGKTDLSISCGTPRFVVAIENKVDSGEHSMQLSRYSTALEQQFPGVRCLRILLTRTGIDPSEPNWVPYSYADVHRVLSRLRRTAGGSLGGEVGVFLDHYLNLLSSQFMDNQEISELCRRIYANHRRAIDLINSYAPVAGSESLAPLVAWIQERPTNWVVRTQGRNAFLFVPRSWVDRISTSDGAPLSVAPCDLYLECESWGDEDVRVSSRLVVGPALDQTRRQRVIQQLMAPEYGLQMQRKKPSEKYTRLASRTLATWDRESEVPADKLIAEFEGWLSRLDSILAHIPGLVNMPTA